MALSLAVLPKRPGSQTSDLKGPRNGVALPRGLRLPSPQTQGFMLIGAEHGLFAPEGRRRLAWHGARGRDCGNRGCQGQGEPRDSSPQPARIRAGTATQQVRTGLALQEGWAAGNSRFNPGRG